MPFQNVGGGDIDIQTIVAKNGKGEPDDGSFSMWWYNTTTEKYEYATYCPYGVADDGNIDEEEGLYGTFYEDAWYWVTKDDYSFILVPTGWKHDADALPTINDHEKKFLAGEGFWIMSADAKPNFTISGQVVQLPPVEEYASVALSSGVKQLINNPFPVECDIQTILAKNGKGEPDDGSFSMWWYNTATEKYEYATYCPYGVADDGNIDEEEGLYGTFYEDAWYWVTKDDYSFILVPTGWKHDADALPTLNDHAKVFGVGEATWVMSADAKPFLLFKNPFYSAK